MTKTSFNGKNEDTRIWCEYCRIFVYNNRINRDKHDSSPQHQANFKKKIETLRREEEQKNRSLPSQTASNSTSSTKSFYQATNTTSLTSAASTQNPANILSIKSSKKPSETKTILGLATNSAEAKTVHEPPKKPDDIMTEQRIHLDIKSTVSDLKRKMKDDEKSLMEPTDKSESAKEDASVEALSLFNKKKSK